MSKPTNGYESKACSICGGLKFTKGAVTAFGGLNFAKETKPSNKPMQWGEVRARRCDTCGNLQFFAHPGGSA